MENLLTPKGFRDFLPSVAKKRQFVKSVLRSVFERYGFLPLETPTLEYAEILKGKYGEEEKLIYQFTDRGKRQLALKYDQTVPLARVIAQYPDLPKPFKRYSIQPVYRAENTQKGRYREFLQADFDTVGTPSLLADAEIIAAALETITLLGIKNTTMFINDRVVFNDLEPKFISAIDKLVKIGEDNVRAELVSKGMTKENSLAVLTKIKDQPATETIKQITAYLEGFDPDFKVVFKPTLARGLNYYTGAIYELDIEGSSSIGGGGRYDGLIGMFTKQAIPAVGFSFGFDRLIEAMDEQNLFSNNLEERAVLVTVLGEEFLKNSLGVTRELRASGINTEIYLDPKTKLDKQLKYADQKEIKYAIIIGSEEASKKLVTVKDLATKEQKQIALDELISFFR